MACPPVFTGQDFLGTALAHVDCQAATLGSYGWSALASPGSPVLLALTGLLTIFVALFGLRLMLGYPVHGRDLVGDALRLGIVLTLVTSWPAWQVIGYNLVIHGPAQIAQAISAGSGLPGSGGDFVSRLQTIDQGLAAFNVFGSGRLGVAQGDWFQLGFARIAWLGGTLGSLALVRLSAGIMLALGPLMAGLLLFGVTRSLFEGWVRMLAATFIASIAVTLTLGVELALLEPWLQDALNRRAGSGQTLDAPVEVLVTTLSFAVISLLSVFLAVRVAFHPGLHVPAAISAWNPAQDRPAPRVLSGAAIPSEEPSRAHLVAHAVQENTRREERIADVARTGRVPVATSPGSGQTGTGTRMEQGHESLGASWRRSQRRVSAAGRRRDHAQ